MHRFSKCSVRSPRAPREKPRGSASYSFSVFECPEVRTIRFSNKNLDMKTMRKEPFTVFVDAFSVRQESDDLFFFLETTMSLLWGSVSNGVPIQGAPYHQKLEKLCFKAWQRNSVREEASGDSAEPELRNEGRLFKFRFCETSLKLFNLT